MSGSIARRGLVALTLFVSSIASAGTHFEHLRDDQTVPQACRQLSISDFKGNIRYIMMGVKGARKAGFSHEIPINRETARELFAAGQALASKQVPTSGVLDKVRQDPTGVKYLDIIANNFKPMGFEFHSEGEVLELLGLVSLRNEYPTTEYFHTGGVAYHKRGEGTVIGELDLLVGRIDTCDIVLVGEAKLGNSASAAKGQLQRFRKFINSKGVSY